MTYFRKRVSEEDSNEELLTYILRRARLSEKLEREILRLTKEVEHLRFQGAQADRQGGLRIASPVHDPRPTNNEHTFNVALQSAASYLTALATENSRLLAIKGPIATEYDEKLAKNREENELLKKESFAVSALLEDARDEIATLQAAYQQAKEALERSEFDASEARTECAQFQERADRLNDELTRKAALIATLTHTPRDSKRNYPDVNPSASRKDESGDASH